MLCFVHFVYASDRRHLRGVQRSPYRNAFTYGFTLVWPKDSPKGGPQDSPKGGPKDSPKGGPKDSPKGGPQDSPKGGPKDSPKGGPKDLGVYVR